MQFLYTRPVTAFRWNSINFLLLSNRIPPSNGATWVGLPIRMFARANALLPHSTPLPKTWLEGRFGVARFSKTWAHSLISIECECCSQGGRRKREEYHIHALRNRSRRSEKTMFLFETTNYSPIRIIERHLSSYVSYLNRSDIEERSRVWLPI